MGIPKERGHCSTNPPQQLKGHKGKVRLGGFILLLNSPSERKQGKPSCPTAAFQHSKTRKIPIPLNLSIPRHFPSSQGWLPQVLAAREPPSTTTRPCTDNSLPVCLQQPLSWQPAWPQQLPTRLVRSCCSPLDFSSIITGLVCCHTPSLCASSCPRMLPESSPRNQQDKRCLTIPNPSPGLAPSIPLTPGAPCLLPSLGGNQGVSRCPSAPGTKLGSGSQTFSCC